mgnify:CR=1 FL=1
MQIQRSFKGDRGTGTLFLVPTPIGNRDDMSYRMIQTLKEVDLIAAEDTRNTGLLLKHFEIRTPQTSFHEHNAMEKIPDLLAHLESGKDLAQVSDAGLPSISASYLLWLSPTQGRAAKGLFPREIGLS